MNINSDIPLALANLQCTPKAFEQVQNYSNSHELSGRERQCLFLMMRNDDLSLMALNKFIEKIDIASLVQRGFLSLIDARDASTAGVSYHTAVNQITKATHTVALNDTKINNNAPVIPSDVPPAVALLSGNFD